VVLLGRRRDRCRLAQVENLGSVLIWQHPLGVAFVINMSGMGLDERKELLNKYPNGDIVDDHLKVETRYVHDGGDFVHLETDVGRMSIRWHQHVVAYMPRQQLAADG
jgi:hypothetical protein